MDRLAPTRRPAGRAQGSQRWHRLLFLHWEVPAEVLRPLLHPRLSLDAFEGRCLVGAVAFTMQRVRPYAWAPPFPTATEFHELNLRTYVHLEGGEPGVWFFSLDAASSLAVAAARTLWRLPYHRTDFSHADGDGRVVWGAERRWPGARAGLFGADFRVGAPLPSPSDGSLEFFLAERYQFYAAGRGGSLLRARVHHPPYPLHRAEVARAEAGPLLAAAGLGPPRGERLPDLFSPGVDVEVFPLERVP
jgi:uncharacterized protein YqjF (DUF2071 family)